MIACPHALGLAIPLVGAIATERAARGGVLREGSPRPGEHAHRGHRALRQDRHPHQGRARRDAPSSRRPVDPTGPRLAAAAEPIPSTRSPARSSRAEHGGRPPARRLHLLAAVGVTATVDGRRCRSAARTCCEHGAAELRRPPVEPTRRDRPARPRRRRGGAVRVSWRTRSARVARGRRRPAPPRRAGGDDHRRRRAGRRPVAAELGIDRVLRRGPAEDKATRSSSCRPRAAGSPWSATA